MEVSLFLTCLTDTLFPQTGKALVRLLERLGHRVEFPLEQTCCGQMHVNSGYAQEALGLVDRMVQVFEGAEAVVSPSASCTALVREVCVATDNSCLMHIWGGAKRRGLPLRTLHLAEVLAAS